MNIHASHCERCSRTIVSPREICPYCGRAAGAMTPLQVDSVGKILSYTTLQATPEGFSPPLKMALVELNDGPVLLCLAHNEEQAEMRIGANVAIDIDQDNRFRFHLLS